MYSSLYRKHADSSVPDREHLQSFAAVRPSAWIVSSASPADRSAFHSIAQIYVHGDSLEDHVVAVIVPDPEKFAALSSKALGKHIVASDAAALAAAAKEQRVVEAIGAELAPYAKDARLLK